MNGSREEQINRILGSLSSYASVKDGRVEFADSDSFGVVHNVKYFYWLEAARTDYFRNIGVGVNNNTFTREFLLMTVRHAADYYAPLKFNDIYKIYTRISYLKNSSFGFENIITGPDEQLVLNASSTLVYLDSELRQPAHFPDEYREKILNYEIGKVILPEQY